MANCNKLFLDFNADISLTQAKKTRLIKSKNDLRKRIVDYFKKNHSDYVPKFYIQGSYKMKTMIRTKDDECDLDDGVYFTREEGVTGTTLQSWVKNAIDGAANLTPEHRKKCIRQSYQSDYHIDLPVYYFPKGNEHPLLCIKNESVSESDPKEVVDWFKKNTDIEGQLIRIVKYLKAWCDHKRNKMPSGLAMTILTQENLSKNVRDDIALKDTLESIEISLKNDFQCKVPGTPFDDLFEDYDDVRKDNFLINLESFINDAKLAVNETNQLRASKLWKKHLGDRFPLGVDENVDAKQEELSTITKSILSGTAKTDKNGNIQSNDGVKNKSHKNYGG